MKIAIVIDKFDDCKNGASVSAQRFVNEKRKNGHEVIIISTGQPNEDKFVVPEYYIPFFKNVIQKMDFCFGVPNEKTLRDAFKDVDIVHLHFPFKLQRKAYKIASEMKIPVIAAFHIQPENLLYNIGLKRAKFLIGPIYRYMIATFYNKFDHIHCPTDFAANQLKKYGCKSNLHTISNGFLQRFHPENFERPPEWQNKFVILTVGRLAKEKNQRLIIKAIDRSKYRDQIQLIISGSGPQKHNLIKHGEVLPNKPIIGYQSDEDLLKYFNLADLYVHASNIELESISTLEAMACGLPPLISDSPFSATPHFAIDDRSLFKYNNLFDLTAKIEYWIENPIELSKKSDQYFEKSKNYTLSVSVKKAEKLYKNIIETHKQEIEELDVHDHKVKVWAPLTLKIDKDYQIIKFSKIFNFFSSSLIALVTPLLYGINKIFFGMKIKNKKKLKELKKQGYITVSNHCHIFDTVMINNLVWPRKIHYPSLKVNFEIPVVRHLLRIFRSFPIPPGISGFTRIVKPIKQALDNNDVVHFFPEASLWPYHQEVRPFVEGAFYLAYLTEKPIVPIALTFRKRKILPPATTIEILDPIYPENYKQSGTKTREIVKNLSDDCYKTISERLKDWYK